MNSRSAGYLDAGDVALSIVISASERSVPSTISTMTLMTPSSVTWYLSLLNASRTTSALNKTQQCACNEKRKNKLFVLNFESLRHDVGCWKSFFPLSHVLKARFLHAHSKVRFWQQLYWAAQSYVLYICKRGGIRAHNTATDNRSYIADLVVWVLGQVGARCFFSPLNHQLQFL